MSITRLSATDLPSAVRDFTSEESAALDRLSDEEIEAGAASDPDARPASADMFRRGQADRDRRLARETLSTALLGARLRQADPDLDLPIWQVTDERGRVAWIQAADVRRVTVEAAADRILRIETPTPDHGAAPERREAARRPERQKA